jgi:hypothetical protein
MGPRLCKPIILMDEAGCKWTVSCTCFVSGSQLHCRLTDGWSAFCKKNPLVNPRASLPHSSTATADPPTAGYPPSRARVNTGTRLAPLARCTRPALSGDDVCDSGGSRVTLVATRQPG